MATKQQYIELKTQLKKIAFENRRNRDLLKNAQRDGTAGWKVHYTLAYSRYEFRHKHIIASLLRGKTRDQIEPCVRYGNEPDESYLKTLSVEYEVEKGIECGEASHVAETVCS